MSFTRLKSHAKRGNLTLQQIKTTQLPNQSKLYSPSFLEESELFETIFLFLMSKSSLLAFIYKEKKEKKKHHETL